MNKDKKDINKENQNKKGENEQNSPLKQLFKTIQNEIKNIVISRLHNQVYKLIKELDKLKKENTIIKNDLVYILKRIINSKKDYTILNQSLNNLGNNSCINLNSNIKFNNNSMISLNKSKNSFVFQEKANNLENNKNNKSRTKISLMQTPENISNFINSENDKRESKYHLDNKKYKNIDNKIDSYLNSLYRHNFIDSHIGSESNYNLNKSSGLYDELFNNQNSAFDINMKKHNLQKNSTTPTEFKKEKGKTTSAIKYKDYKSKNNNLSIIINKNNFLRKKYCNKVNIYRNNGDNSSLGISNNNINNNLMNKNINGFYSMKNKKNNSKNNIIATHRSPFIINKF